MALSHITESDLYGRVGRGMLLRMATLATYRRGRDVIGRCDASCYDGTDARCVCLICRGQNHGVGYDAAVAQTPKIVAVWYAVRVLEGGPRRDRIVLGLACVQLALF